MDRKTGQTIHPCFASGPDETPLYFIIPNDGNPGYCLGERWELARLHEKLTALLEYDQHDGVIESTHPAIHKHITPEEAAKMSGLTSRAIRAACTRGDIVGAFRDGGRWSIPIRHFRYWMRNERMHKPGRKTKSS